MITKSETLIHDIMFKSNISITNTKPIHRVGYLLELQSQQFGYQWVYTEFDAFSQDPDDFGIPIANGKVIKQAVNNLDIRSSDGVNESGLANGHIEFSAYNYGPGANNYDTNDDLTTYMNEGRYGCMQVHGGTNVLWAFNRHNEAHNDLGIGNNVGNEHKDWTFMSNSSQYTHKRLRVFAITQEFVFEDNLIAQPKINLLGVAHGDPLIWNATTEELGQIQIPFDSSGDISKPNFIIALTGQSNSQGTGSFYDSNEPNDQPHERIFGFNPTSQLWETADLNTESLGASWHKSQGSQSLAFHFARRLVEAYPNIRPGIINVGVGGQAIARWAKFPEGHAWYQVNTERATAANVNQGDIYDHHVDQINLALQHLDTRHRSVDVLCWHQGESDGWTDGSYYSDCINKVIEQYRSEPWCSKTTPFVVGETTGADIGTDQGWEARNVQLRQLNFDADRYTKCVYCADLETSDAQYDNSDFIHFSARAQRTMGTRYFRAFRGMFEES